MKLIKYIIMVLALIGSTTLSAETTINKDSVNQMLTEIQNAVHKQDITLFASYFTDDSTITIEMPENMGGATTLSKRDYIVMLQQGWALPANFTYEVRDIEIEVAADRKSAVVKDVTIETIEINGETIASSRSYETMDIIIHNGALRINSLHARVEL